MSTISRDPTATGRYVACPVLVALMDAAASQGRAPWRGEGEWFVSW